MRAWLAMLIGAVLLAGFSAFFLTQGLGKATDYAGVASFFLALLTAIGSMLSLIRSKSNEQAADGSTETHAEAPDHAMARNLAWNNENVQQGTQSVMNIDKTVHQHFRRRSGRNR